MLGTRFRGYRGKGVEGCIEADVGDMGWLLRDDGKENGNTYKGLGFRVGEAKFKWKRLLRILGLGFPKIGVPIIRTMIFAGRFLCLRVQGNYNLGSCKVLGWRPVVALM